MNEEDYFSEYKTNRLMNQARFEHEVQRLVEKAAEFIGNQDKSTWGLAVIDAALYHAEQLRKNLDVMYDPVCRKCGDPLTTEELICDGCRKAGEP
jgi:hypothetical protein